MSISILISICFIFFQDSVELIPFNKNGLWGYSNVAGEIIIKPKYEEAHFYNDDLALVKINGKFGYINKTGEFRLFPIYEEATSFKYGNAVVVLRGESRFINTRGAELAKYYTGATCGSPIHPITHFKTYTKGNKIGILLPFRYPIIINSNKYYKDSLPSIWDDFKENRNGYAAVKLENKWGVIDSVGKLIIPYKFDEVMLQGYSGSKAIITIADENYGIINKDGIEISEPQYQKIEFSNKKSYLKVWLNETNWAYLNENGTKYFDFRKRE